MRSRSAKYHNVANSFSRWSHLDEVREMAPNERGRCELGVPGDLQYSVWPSRNPARPSLGIVLPSRDYSD